MNRIFVAFVDELTASAPAVTPYLQLLRQWEVNGIMH